MQITFNEMRAHSPLAFTHRDKSHQWIGKHRRRREYDAETDGEADQHA